MTMATLLKLQHGSNRLSARAALHYWYNLKECNRSVRRLCEDDDLGPVVCVGVCVCV